MHKSQGFQPERGIVRATALLLAVLTFSAAYLPARRALGVAPIEALRNDA